jgi:hypothetical protein
MVNRCLPQTSHPQGAERQPSSPAIVQQEDRSVGGGAELLVGVAMVAISSLFVGLRLANHDFDATVFILAGEEVTDPAVNPDMFIVEGAFGYDGQRYYRLSRNPFTSEVEEFGITFDRPAYWQKRIGYPFIVWLVSGFGRAEVVPWMMIAVNVVAVGVIGTVAARLARMHERSPWLGLIPAAWGGYVVAISQNLTEAVVGAFLIASLLGSPPTTLGPGRRGTGGSGSHPGNIAHLLGRAPSHVVLSARAASRCCQG